MFVFLESLFKVVIEFCKDLEFYILVIFGLVILSFGCKRCLVLVEVINMLDKLVKFFFKIVLVSVYLVFIVFDRFD